MKKQTNEILHFVNETIELIKQYLLLNDKQTASFYKGKAFGILTCLYIQGEITPSVYESLTKYILKRCEKWEK